MMKQLIQLLVLTNLLITPLLAAGATSVDNGFDHFSTGFPLEREHAELFCDDCHYQGTFNNTPRLCVSCHSQSGFTSASSKSASHINSGNTCDDCHTEDSWEIVTRIDHGATFGNCISCHNGTVATGKHAQHLKTNNICEDCHITNNWNTTGFDHTGITPGTCGQCHNDITATGLPTTHLKTSRECDSCHSTNNWQPAQFRHNSATYPGDHRSDLSCQECHQNNSETINWRYAVYKPDCAACHAGDYEQDEHKKTESPRRYYNVSELRDCSSSCHVYSDSSMTTIVERRNSLHRVNDREFDD